MNKYYQLEILVATQRAPYLLNGILIARLHNTGVRVVQGNRNPRLERHLMHYGSIVLSSKIAL